MNKKFLILLILVCFLFFVSVAIDWQNKRLIEGRIDRLEELVNTLKLIIPAKEVKIGGVACLTGGAATYGASTRNGCVLAFKAVNAEGGVDIGGTKYLINYIFEDDQGSPEVAANAFRKLIDQDEVVAILGSVMS